jgi:hypothetical protein
MVYRRDWGQPQPGNMGFMRTAKAYGRKVNIAAADLGAGGVVGMFRLPPFFLVAGGTITTLAATGFNYPIYNETEIQFATAALPGAAAAGILEYYLWGTIFA